MKKVFILLLLLSSLVLGESYYMIKFSSDARDNDVIHFFHEEGVLKSKKEFKNAIYMLVDSIDISEIQKLHFYKLDYNYKKDTERLVSINVNYLNDNSKFKSYILNLYLLKGTLDSARTGIKKEDF